MKRTRITAALVLVAIVLSLFSYALASGTTGSAGQIQREETLPVYHTLNESGESTATSTDPVNSASKESGTSSVAVSKTISPTNTENQFTIDLEVVTTEDIKDVNITADAAVVLVIDASASMWGNIAGKGVEWEWDTQYSGHWTTSIPTAEQRLTLAKTAAINFAKDFAQDAGDAKRMISVVTFNSDAATVLEWTDASTADWSGETPSNAITAAINGIGVDSSTNPSAGLNLASGLLDTVDTAAGKTIGSTYVVLITDGQPNKPSQPQNDTTSDSDEEYAAKAAAAQATVIKNKGAVLYTMAFAAADLECYTPVVTTTHECTQTGWHRHSEKEIKENGYGWSYNGRFYGPHTGTTEEDGAPVTVGQWLSSIASSANHYINAANGEQLSIGLEEISSRIRQLASAWQVTDPMGQYIKLNANSITGSNNATVNEAGDTITWNLKADAPAPVTADGVTTYTYKLQYTITLDTAAQGFLAKDADENDVYHLTNGYTKLDYYFVEEVLDAEGKLLSTVGNDTVRTIDFKVPAVKGEIPLVDYTVEHYLLNRDGTVPTTPEDTETINDVALWSAVNITAKDYSGKNYSYSYGDAGAGVTLTPDKLTFKLYYTPVTTSVTVNHYYKETTIAADGSSVTSDYALRHTKTDGTTAAGEPNAKLYAGDNYTVGTATTLGFIYDGYTKDKVADKNDKALTNDTLKLTNTAADNVINVYYSRTTDNSEASVTVTHTYNTYGWVLDTDPTSPTYGRYVEKLTGTSSSTTDSSSGIKLATQKTYSASLTPVTGNEAFTYVSASSTTDSAVTVNTEAKTATIDLVVGSNDLNLVFEKRETRPGDAAEFTVEHIYSKSVTTIVDGQISTEGSFTNQSAGPVAVTGYAPNETYVVSPVTSYNGEDGFTCITTTLSYTVEDNLAIKIYYTKTVTPQPSTLTAIHVYRDWETYTIPESEGGDGIATGLRQTNAGTEETTTVTYPAEGSVLYAGQNVPVGLVGKTDYTFNTTDSGISAAGQNVAASGQTIYIYYDKTDDVRTPASVTVIHHYETLLDTVIGGVVTPGYVVDNGSYTEAARTGQAGDVWSTTARTSHTLANSVTTYTDYTLDTSRSGALSGTMVGDQTIDLYYTRTDSDLTSVTYNVVYEYYEQEMTFNDQGVAGYWTAPVKLDTRPTGAPADITGAAAYLNQTVNLTSGAGTFDGKTFALKSDSAPDTTATITVDGQTITLKYLHQIAKTPTTVTVTHHYWTTTYDAANIPGTPVDAPSQPVTYDVFVGETFRAAAVITAPYSYNRVDDSDNIVTASQDETTKDYTITVPDGASTIDFHYSYENKTQVTPATWTVEHWYRTLYWNDPADKAYTMDTPAQAGSSYATLTVTGTPDLKPDSNGAPTYTLDRAETTPGAFAEGTYTITLQGGENVIRFYYTNEVPPENTQVQVVHVYRAQELYNNPDGTKTLDGSTFTVYTTIAENVWVGNRFTAVPVYSYTVGTGEDAVTYTDYALDGDYSNELTIESLQAVPEEGQTPNVITINYLRTTNTTPTPPPYIPGPSYYSITVNYISNVDGSQLANAHVETRAYGNNYDVSAYDAIGIAGYVYDRTEGDALSGRVDGNKVINVYYDAEGEPTTEPTPEPTPTPTDIPDENPPLNPTPVTPVQPVQPGTDIPDDEPPLSDAPKTGDETSLGTLWVLLALGLGGLGLCTVQSIRSKKRSRKGS